MQYGFAKSSRFAPMKQNTNAFGYGVKGHFDDATKKNAAGQGQGFASSEYRFGFDEKRRLGKAPAAIDGPADKDARSNSLAHTHSYSFGVSRTNMKKLYVEEILRNSNKNESTPGPGKYESPVKVGCIKDSYSMRQKLDLFAVKLKKSNKLPGPGSYTQLDLTGRLQNDSKVPNSQSSAFQRSSRFNEMRTVVPSPAQYSPKESINQNFNSTHKYMGATKFGANRRTFVEESWALRDKEVSPGPGSYKRFSDFTGIEK